MTEDVPDWARQVDDVPDWARQVDSVPDQSQQQPQRRAANRELMPSLRQDDQPSFMERAAGFARGIPEGVVAGALGLPGDIETLGRGIVRGAMTRDIRRPGRDVDDVIDPGSILPTSRNVAESLFDTAVEPGQETGRSVGEFLSPGLATRALQTGLRVGSRMALGTTTGATENLARRAENLGFRLEPRQLRSEKPLGSPGFGGASRDNQILANRLASRETGMTVDEITPEFVGSRMRALGGELNNIFNRPFRVDRQLVDDLQAMRDFEIAVRPATAQSVAPAANNIIERYAQASQGVGGNVTRFTIPGNELQALRSEMADIARTAPDGMVRRRAGEFVERIDGALARFDPVLARRLQETNRRYAATATLRDLIESKGIQQGNISLEQLGNNMAREVYGYGAGTGRHPLTELGTLGRELKIRGRFEGVEGPTGELAALTSRMGRTLGFAGRLPAARRLQQSAQQPRGSIRTPVTAGTAGGAAGRMVEDYESGEGE